MMYLRDLRRALGFIAVAGALVVTSAVPAAAAKGSPGPPHPVAADQQPVGAAGEDAALQARALEGPPFDVEDAASARRCRPDFRGRSEIRVIGHEVLELHVSFPPGHLAWR